MLHSVDNQIELINSTIAKIYADKDKFKISEGEAAAIAMEALAVAERVQRRRSDVEEVEVVGFDGYAIEITNMLLKNDNNKSLEVVSIFGMLGCGKTTLARKVYKEIQLQNLFDCCAWVFVTQEFNAKELLISLLRQFNAIPGAELKGYNYKKGKKEENNTDSKTEALEIAILKKKLQAYLSDMRYLIVLDDMWSNQVWEEIKDAFPNDNMGSRILITTRLETVALKVSTVNKSYKVEPLGEEDSWILLSKKVFMEEKCPPDLEITGRSIATACKGLPLSIVVIGGILRSKEKSERVWKKVMGNVKWFIDKEDALVKEIVRLSYDSLPIWLKPCFLYFGIYPEDYIIPARQLIHLWIAEGFITKTGGGTITEEDIAEEYLEELIRRNMIQLESKRTDGGVKTCRIHDLLRELCISESIEENFLEVRTDIDILKKGKPRRLSLHGSTSYYMSESPDDHSSIRSLFSFSKGQYDAYELKEWIQKNFTLIRVLDMGHVESVSSALKGLEEPIHLRYLRARENNYMLSFPKSIYELWNIETLDLRGSEVIHLSKDIWKLKRLRHLYMSGYYAELPDIPRKKILPNVQTLSVVRFNQKTMQQLEKGKFPNLQKLGVNSLDTTCSDSIEYLCRLQCLTKLNKLKVLFGRGTLRNVVGFPPNITKITLVGCFSLSNIVSYLGCLSKLQYLKMLAKTPASLEKFEFESTKFECFSQLLVLKMNNLNCMSWNLGMPQLRRLVINNCELSTNLSSVESFASLQQIEVSWCSKDVVDKLQHLVLRESCKLTVYPALDE